MATAMLSAPDDTDALTGATLLTIGDVVVPFIATPFITAPENFTDFQTPQAGSSIAFG